MDAGVLGLMLPLRFLQTLSGLHKYDKPAVRFLLLHVEHTFEIPLENSDNVIVSLFNHFVSLYFYIILWRGRDADAGNTWIHGRYV